MKRKKIQSWLGVFKQRAQVIEAFNKYELIDAIEKYPDAKVIGKSHSYNRSALWNTVIIPQYELVVSNPEDKTAIISAGTRVETVIHELMKHGRSLINSGNFFQQSFIGAACGSTHGYGSQASLMDQVIDKVEHKGWILQVTIRTKEMSSYRVRHRAIPFSRACMRQNKKRSFAVLPYSHPTDPIALCANYLEIKDRRIDHQDYHVRIDPPLHLKLFWCADSLLPFIRKWAQKIAYYYRLDAVMYTSPVDYDSLYDPAPGIAGRDTWKFAIWSFRPTFQAYNIALFVKPQDTEEFVLTAICEGEKLKRGLFKSFIGVREMTDKSDYERAGNYDGPRNAIDFYVNPRHAKHLIKLQRILQAKFDTRAHWGKTVMEEL